MKVKTDYVPEDCDYLTAGKEYEVIDVCHMGLKHLHLIVDDRLKVLPIRTDACSFLNGRAWKIVG